MDAPFATRHCDTTRAASLVVCNNSFVDTNDNTEIIAGSDSEPSEPVRRTRLSQSELTAFLSKEEAARILDVSLKTIERYSDGRTPILRKYMRQMGRNMSRPCYNPADVNRLREEKQSQLESQRVHLADAELLVHSSSSNGLLSSSGNEDAMMQIAEVFAGAIEEIATAVKQITTPRAAIPIHQKFLLSVKEAAQLGFRAGYLRAAVRDGRLQNFGAPRRMKLSRLQLLKTIDV